MEEGSRGTGLKQVPIPKVCKADHRAVKFLKRLMGVVCRQAGSGVHWEEDQPVMDNHGRLNKRHHLV